jgi:hypothetical protein
MELEHNKTITLKIAENNHLAVSKGIFLLQYEPQTKIRGINIRKIVMYSAIYTSISIIIHVGRAKKRNKKCSPSTISSSFPTQMRLRGSTAAHSITAQAASQGGLNMDI